MSFPEKNSILSYFSYRQKLPTGKRVSFCLSCSSRGSITVEAALVMPLFFFAVLALCYMLEVMAVRTSIRSGLQSAGREAAQRAFESPLLLTGQVEKDLIRAVGGERLDRSIVEDGSRGLHCEDSYGSMRTGILELKVSYRVFLPLPVFGRVSVPMGEHIRVKGWTGYEPAGFLEGEEEIVYITETGMVYHKDVHCSYLDLSVRPVLSGEVEQLRNRSQEIYRPCEECGGGHAGGMVYITDYGNRYHRSLSCSGLKRTVYAVPLQEAAGKGACAKCGYR